MMEAVHDVEKVCVNCAEGSRDGDPLNHVGSRFQGGEDKKHPLDTITEHATKLKLDALVTKLNEHKQQQIPTYIHLSCRSFLKNQSRPKRKTAVEEELGSSKRISRRSEVEKFDFKEQCFYCGKICIFDVKHPDRRDFEEVTTKYTKIYIKTLELCKSREDAYAKTIERRLLSVNDLVAAEARYHKSCRSTFENILPKRSSKGRPTSTRKVDAFEKTCKLLEDDMELYTVKEFQELMESQNEDVYSMKMTKIKLQEKYGESVQFVSRRGKSDIILLGNTSSILTEAWYNDRKSEPADEAERVIRAAAKLIINEIKNHEHITEYYPSIEDIQDTTKCHVPVLLKKFVDELIKHPLKQASVSQAIFAGARPRSIMPLQFGLAVATDNRLASKWLSTLLSRLGFAVSYDEVS